MFVKSRPPNSILPLTGDKNPAIACKRVVLPSPLGPINANALLDSNLQFARNSNPPILRNSLSSVMSKPSSSIEREKQGETSHDQQQRRAFRLVCSVRAHKPVDDEWKRSEFRRGE